MTDFADKNCLDKIDAIVYINLQHRKDRNDHFLNEIRKIDPFLSKIHRIEAIYNHNNGALGCTLSHIKALEYCISNNWNNYIIFEDDFSFVSNNSNDIYNSILHLLESLPNFDIILLGQGVDNLISLPTKDTLIRKINSSQTASGYIVSKQYSEILLKNFKESCELMLLNGRREEFCLDQYWKRLMPDGNWYAHKYRIGYQYENYSDIEKKFVNYNC